MTDETNELDHLNALAFGMNHGVIPLAPVPGEKLKAYASRVALAGIALGEALAKGELSSGPVEKPQEGP